MVPAVAGSNPVGHPGTVLSFEFWVLSDPGWGACLYRLSRSGDDEWTQNAKPKTQNCLALPALAYLTGN